MRLRTKGRRNNKRRVPQLNTTATADISFMLLIFFLVTTSMDTDLGMRRKLPPKDVQEEVKAVDVDRQNVLTIAINASNDICINDTVVDDKQLEKRVTSFIVQRGDKHILELQASRSASYDKYFHLQNILAHVYRDNLKRKYKQQISETYVP